MLIGLDWAEPMMQFPCMSHVHAFPMHTYSLFNILVIFHIAWHFSDCFFFFSPRFMFTLAVSMAPKRKSTPARNSLHSEASLSSDPTLSHIWFRDDVAFKAFSENFSR